MGEAGPQVATAELLHQGEEIVIWSPAVTGNVGGGNCIQVLSRHPCCVRGPGVTDAYKNEPSLPISLIAISEHSLVLGLISLIRHAYVSPMGMSACFCRSPDAMAQYNHARFQHCIARLRQTRILAWQSPH